MNNPAIKMPSFNFYSSFSGIFKGLSYSDRGMLITWIMWYVFEGSLPQRVIDNNPKDETNDRLVAAFENIVPTIDKQMQKYIEYLKQTT